MQKASGYTSLLTALVLTFALLYPSVHIFQHAFSGNSAIEHLDQSTSSDQNIVDSNIDCDICDFNLSGYDCPEFHSYDVYVPVKETLYSLSLTQTAWSSPDLYFSLRAPPASRI